MIIGITGKQQVGKDTLAGYLANKHHCHRIGFADQLKRICRSYLGWDGNKDDGGRKLLQHIGTSTREYSPSFWIEQTDFMMRHIELGMEEQNIRWVIPDVRFRNEADWIKSKGGIIIRVVRNTGIIDTHISETEMDAYQPDYTLQNNALPDNMFREADKILR